jgi:hypothetical protein
MSDGEEVGMYNLFARFCLGSFGFGHIAAGL